MQRFKQIFAVCLCVYLLYEVKSAAGINFSQRYHAIDLVKVPAKFAVHKLKAIVEPNTCQIPCQNG